MKKLISSLFAFAVIFSMTVLASCGGAPDVSKVIEKHDNGEALTEADYSALIDYADAALDGANSILKEITEATEKGDFDALKDLEKKGEELEAKYPDMSKVADIIQNASGEEMGESNVAKVEIMMEKYGEIFSMIVLASCGGAPDVSKIVEKHDNGEALTEADYSALIDYVDAEMDDVISILKEIREASEKGDSDALKDLEEKAEKWEAKYSDINKVVNIIENVSDEDLGESNVAKAKKIIEKVGELF